jgi:predicted phage terminase large subunit-like protein
MELSLRERLKYQVIARAKLPLAEERAALEGSLLGFVEAAWPSLDPSRYQPSWVVDAMCEHLQAVTEGQIRRLLINVPPRSGKTLVTSVCFPAWTWARAERSYLSGSQVRFLCGSYNDDLSLQNSTRQRRLLMSPWFQRLWAKRVRITPGQDTKSKFDTIEGGSRISTSARGSLLGIGGDLILIDDPHNLTDIESDAERETTRMWWREISSTRLNDPKQSAIVVIMQRLHEDDVSGVILSSDWSPEWTHLMIPAEYEWRRHCVTVLDWHDPRGLDDKDEPLVKIQPDGARVPRDSAAQAELEQREGALMWPERFGPREIARIKAELGPALSSGRLQQSPSPAKGGLFLREWWELYESPDGKFPPFDHVVASLDSAFTAKEQNDPSALTIWGVFSLPPSMQEQKQVMASPGSWRGEVLADKRQRVQEMPEGWSANVGKPREHRRIMLIHAWRKHLPFSGPRIEKIPGETRNMYKRRTSESWGLLEWVEHTCTRFKIDKLLIEAKASGISAAQELRNRYGFQGWSIETRPVKGDKVARALAVQPLFSQGMVYAPSRDWAELVMSEMAMFPAGRFDDLTDSATQALKYLRDRGWGRTDEEERQAEIGTVMHRPRLGRLYPC